MFYWMLGQAHASIKVLKRNAIDRASAHFYWLDQIVIYFNIHPRLPWY